MGYAPPRLPKFLPVGIDILKANCVYCGRSIRDSNRCLTCVGCGAALLASKVTLETKSYGTKKERK